MVLTASQFAHCLALNETSVIDQIKFLAQIIDSPLICHIITVTCGTITGDNIASRLLLHPR